MDELVKNRKMVLVNEVSPSFCLAKWLQVTVDLVHGTTHSCHHPQRHPVPLDELARSPSALHNTSFKKQQRKLMLEGIRPPECSYCWEVEDASKGAISDRLIKSSDPWAFPELERVRGLAWDADISPTYLEVMLDDVCNFSCMYCMADISRSVAKEMEAFGPYRVSNPAHRMPQHPKPAGSNPFFTAFQEWLPEILPNLQVLRVTGGEPLLSPKLDTLLAELQKRRQSTLKLVVNSHLGHAPHRIDRFCEKISDLLEGGHIGSFELYTSVDGAGPQAEFMRHGLAYRSWLQNVVRVTERLPDVPLVVMCTFNLLSITSFPALLTDIRDLKLRAGGVSLDISTLRDPNYLRADMADESLRAAIRALQGFMQAADCFSDHETLKLSNAITWATSPRSPETLSRNRADFFVFIEEYSRRKGKSFLEVFPGYRDFFILCKTEAFRGLPIQNSQSRYITHT